MRSATAVQAIGAKRVVINSLTGFELALAPTFRDDFRESLYRLVGALTGTGITVLMTMEIVQSTTDLRLSPYVISFLADDIILLRYVEIAGQLRKSLVVIKMRNSDHSNDAQAVRDHRAGPDRARIAAGLPRHRHRHACGARGGPATDAIQG